VILLWFGAMAVGFGLSLAASRRAVHHGSALASSTNIPPFIIGVTLFAIGTDLPEIANSIISSAAGHGDLNVGDSVGSTLVQATLVLGLLPLLVGPFRVKQRIGVIGTVTVAMLVVGVLLASDGQLTRLDGTVLLGGWVVGTLLTWRYIPAIAEPVMPVPARRRSHNAVAALTALGLVGAGAALAVAAFIEIAKEVEISEYVISFFVASIGTSLPELIFTVTALRRSERDLAVGDVMGSSFVDATLSIGIGPFLFPTAVTASQAVRGGLVAAVTIAIVVVVLTRVAKHDWRTGLLLIGLYAASYPALLLL